MQTMPFPEPISDEIERFMIYSRAEILELLRRLRDDAILVTAYFGVESEFVVTCVLQVKPDFEEVIFDCAADALAQRRMLAAGGITFVAFLANVKVQFSAQAAEPVAFENKPAFRVRIPEQLLRLQRRDYFRVSTPVARPATVLVPHARNSHQYESLRVMDISVGGMALLSYPEMFELAPGGVVENCFLDLPGVGSVSIRLRVRHVDDVPRDSDKRRCGCEFVDLSPQARLMLQRYVNKIEGDARRLAVSGEAAAA